MTGLSTKQQQIFELSEQDLTPAAIAEKLRIPERVVKAQLTRIQGKLHKKMVSEERRGARAKSRGRSRATTPAPASEQPTVTTAKVEQALQDVGEKAVSGTEVHPMILLGVTIQFVKLVGGRMRAHQVIEEVYDALRVMVDGGSKSSTGQVDQAKFVADTLGQLEESIAKFRESLVREQPA